MLKEYFGKVLEIIDFYLFLDVLNNRNRLKSSISVHKSKKKYRSYVTRQKSYSH